MEEKKAPPSGPGGSVRASSSFVKSGDRQMFTVELRPGETTIVSWKKLMKDANKVTGSNSAPEPPANVHPGLESRIAPGQPTEDDVKDASAPSRFSAVIEKIERLYMGKDSSDDEDLLDVPDDDQYDTEDSFIDDADLDEYFEVDNSAIKHDGFFVNRGKLERLNDPPALPNQQPKKRRRKDLAKNPGEIDDGRGSNKHVKVGKTVAGKTAPLSVEHSLSSSQALVLTNEHTEDLKFRNQLDASGISSKKKIANAKLVLDPSSLKASNGDASLSVLEKKNVDKLKMGVFQSKNTNDKNRDASGSLDVYHHKYHDKSAYVHPKLHLGRASSNVDGLETPSRSKEKNGIRELPDLNYPEGKSANLATNTQYTHRKDGSSVRPKSSMLEKAIRELEKMVAESRPPAVENQDTDTASLAVKRRLPREIKLKLAKVARLAASHGKVSKELINRLMNSLGHMIQLRTLKRNLKVMISMGLSAKQEKDDRFQQIKKEVVEIIKIHAASLESKAIQRQAGESDDFQETGPDGKKSAKRRFNMDTALEDKICDLYDLFVDGLDEDAGPQIRKLYAELAGLWPNGFMDNHGIKRAICRAKERRRALYSRHKDQERIKRKNMLAPKQEETVRVDASSIAQQQPVRERLTPEFGSHGFSSLNKPVSNMTTTAVQVSGPSVNGPVSDRVKQEKLKGGSSNSLDDARLSDGTLIKKKVKRKPELELEGRPEKLPTQQGDERHKPLKQSAGLPQKSSLQPTAVPGVEQSS
ncbi:Wound-responsive family protein, putative isoform 1 [Quillaja saponaria]|uniref:Wound-responsive family protein, putative isoform 1 n=1 Tax=Quillaja saponaria TaxID=32244 RepID=A0AAD7PRQ9_QUISA|nr:Wound-responsive family protein, putative isoform 1 [Quillaja saponaria]